MIYFCADDYGVSVVSNSRIENCINNGALNKVSVLPNGETSELGRCLTEGKATFGLHINLVEGPSLSAPEEISLLVSEDGNFRYSFIGLFLQSFFGNRKKLEEQIYKEIQKQIKFWKASFGEENEVFLDSHQHVHMIPLVFKVLMRAVRDEKLNVGYLRIPAEPVLPYIMTPSLYFSYSPVGIVKQWLLKILALVNAREIRCSQIPDAYFMGVLFSGKMSEKVVNKLLPKYMKLAEKNNKNIEIGFHPGYIENGEEMFFKGTKNFGKFYFSPWRKVEYNALLNLKF